MFETKNMTSSKKGFVGGKMTVCTVKSTVVGEKFNPYQTGHGVWADKKHASRNSKAAQKARNAIKREYGA